MSQAYVLEDGSGNYLWEDGNRAWQDIPTKVNNSTVQLVETSNKRRGLLKSLSDTMGITEISNHFKGLTKTVTQYIVAVEEARQTKITYDNFQLEDGTGNYKLESGDGLYRQDYLTFWINETVGLTESRNKIRNRVANLAETVGLTEVSSKVKGFVKVATQFIVSLEGVVNKHTRFENIFKLEAGNGDGRYLQEDGVSLLLVDNLAIIKNAVTEIIGLTDSKNQIDGTVHWINETVGLTETFNRLRDIVRTFTETVGIVEGIVRVRDIVRNIQTVIQVLNPTERVNRAMVMFRNTTTSTVGVTESSNRALTISKILNEIIGLTEVSQGITGIVKWISSTVGLTDLINKIKVVKMTVNLGVYTSTASHDSGTYMIVNSENVGDMIVIDSYNFGDLIIVDDG